jgi:hypothetical protein
MMLKEKFEDTKEIIRTSEAVHSLLGVLTVVMDHSELEYLFSSIILKFILIQIPKYLEYRHNKPIQK